MYTLRYQISKYIECLDWLTALKQFETGSGFPPAAILCSLCTLARKSGLRHWGLDCWDAGVVDD